MQLFLKATVFFSPFSVTVFGAQYYYAAAAVASIFFVLMAITIPRITLPDELKTVLLIFFFPILISIVVGLPFGYLFSYDFFTYEYYLRQFPGRIFNYLIVIILYLFLSQTVFGAGNIHSLKVNRLRDICAAYWAGIAIIIISSYWQIVSFYFGFGEFPFDTRSHVHSVTVSESNPFSLRVTGLAREPSFLAPLIIDFMLISVIIFSKLKWIFLSFVFALLPLALSFSMGGYVNLIIVMGAFVFLYFIIKVSSGKVNALSIFLGLVVSIIGMALLWQFQRVGGLDLFLSRFDSAFDLEKGGRVFMWIMPYFWLIASSPVNLIFGYGPKSFGLLGSVYSLPNGDSIHVTSNNIFSDFLWEHGLFGLVFLVLFFCYLLFSAINIKMNKFYWVSFLIVVHVMFSSMYRADYASFRFHFMVFVAISIVALCRMARPVKR